jgi:myosin V
MRLTNVYLISQNIQELLIKCLSEDLGFSISRPIAAYLIYRCLIHWRSFEEERTTVFDRITQKITAAFEVSGRLYAFHG